MINLIKRYVDNPALMYILIILVFLLVVGAALYLTPRLSKWLDEKKKSTPGFYDGMLTEDPTAAQNSAPAAKDAGEE